jgi:hypothetical protein
MNRRNLIAGATVVLAGAAVAVPAAVASSGKTVSVRVEGLSTTRLLQHSITPTAAVKKDGHSCGANTAAAALNAATNGRWSGTWSTSLKDFEVMKIDGETDNYTTTKSYWEIFVNNVASEAGICGTTLKPGEQVLFAAVGNSENPGAPITISSSGKNAFTVDYVNAKGKKLPLAGATVTVEKESAKTDSAAGTVATAKTGAKGTATVKVSAAGYYLVVASKKNYIRDETTLTVA